MKKLISVEEAVSKIKDGDTIMVGGFYTVGTPENIVDEILRQGKKDLTIINNDGGNPNSALGRLLYSGNVKKVYLSWCGYLDKLPDMVDSGEIDLELNPQGTLVERIRAGGFGLGGILTPTGLGTMIEEKGYGQRIHLNGRAVRNRYDEINNQLQDPTVINNNELYRSLMKDYKNLTPIVEAYDADEAGNLIFRRTQRNFCDTMCFAGETVIASVVNPIKKNGEIDPDAVMVPGVVVDYLVQREG